MIDQASSLSLAPDAVFRVWNHRLKIEFEASALFNSLSKDLQKIYGPDDQGSQLAKAAAEDELRHAERCREILSHAASPLAEMPPSTTDFLGPHEASPLDRVLYTSVAIGCVTETLSTALLVEMHKRANAGLMKNIIHEILTDEISHGRVGWAELARQSALRDVSWIGNFMSGMIEEALQKDVRPMLKPKGTNEDLSQWGILPRLEALNIMQSTISDVISPGLKHFGVEGRFLMDQTQSL